MNPYSGDTPSFPTTPPPGLQATNDPFASSSPLTPQPEEPTTPTPPTGLKRTAQNIESPEGAPGITPFSMQMRPRRPVKSHKSEGQSVASSKLLDKGAPEPNVRVDVPDQEGDDEPPSNEDEYDSPSDQEDHDDDDNDPDWVGDPQQSTRMLRTEGAQQAQLISPQKRVPPGASITSSVKHLVAGVDPNHGFCILTRTDQPPGVRQFAHIIHRVLSAIKLSMLERKWGLCYYTLYIDTRFNIVALVSNWHIPMDRGAWALVPDYETIALVLQWVEQRRTRARHDGTDPISKLWDVKQTPGQLLKVKKHKYFVLPLAGYLKEVPLHRRPKTEFDPKVPEERHLYPFDKVGPLSSHIQPHFVIYAVGAKLAKIRDSKKMEKGRFLPWLTKLAKIASFGLEPGDDRAPVTNLNALRNILTIYDAWTKKTDLPNKGDPWWIRKTSTL
ncbi:hypothetical protein C8R43DRAFT_1107009 [Mycena crocata]|nr:hypothetical protein C8R43DRAFT_1107009 [Mycena crocata]